MKAQFYSLISILIAIPIFVFVVQYMEYNANTGDAISERVISDQLGQLVNSIEMDTVKAMEISGRRALLAATNYVISSGEALDDPVANITELMTNGTINGSSSFLMLNNTMPDWEQRILSKPVDFTVTLDYWNISIANYDGYSLVVGMDVNITATDKLGKVRIDKTGKRKYAYISVAGLEDPMFPLETGGFIRRIVQRPEPGHVAFKVVAGSSNSSGTCSGPVTFNKSEDDDTKILVAENLTGVVFSRHLGIILEDEDDLSGQISCYVTGNNSAVGLVRSALETGYDVIHIDNETKSAWSMPIENSLPERYYYRIPGPTFLQRLGGDYTASPDGIATFIYVPELQEQAIPVDDYSRVAYRYFSRSGSCYQVDDMPEWFGMDSSDASDMNLTELLTSDPCTVS
ncbi:MAG: hypothetical protein J7K54_04970 [Candidatus Aenigmarchaeota archaeon]|nr:hypothetical protein [Candidatus Aenigmarchaeota archaeon]